MMVALTPAQEIPLQMYLQVVRLRNLILLLTPRMTKRLRRTLEILMRLALEHQAELLRVAHRVMATTMARAPQMKQVQSLLRQTPMRKASPLILMPLPMAPDLELVPPLMKMD
jgi:hypothetical protein